MVFSIRRANFVYMRWKIEDTRFLIENYGNMSIRDIAKALSRTEESVSTRSNVLGLGQMKKRWTKADDRFLSENFKNWTLKQLSDSLNRTEDAVYARMKKLELKRSSKWAWTDKEDKFLRRNYTKFSNPVLAKKLGRTVNSINLRATKLGLGKGFTYDSKYWNREDLEYLLSNKNKKTLKQIAKDLDRPYSSVISRARLIRDGANVPPITPETKATKDYNIDFKTKTKEAAPKICKLYKDGVPSTKIARMFGLSIVTVFKVLKVNNISTRYKNRKNINEKMILKNIGEGMTVRDVAKAHNCSLTSVYKIIKKQKMK